MAKTGKFKCVKCGRTFSMAAHLGRHTATMHASRSTLPVRRALRRPSELAIGRHVNDSRAQLLQQLHRARADLAAQTAALGARLSAVDEVLTLLGGPAHPAATPAARRGHHTARPGTLREHIERVLQTHRGPLQVKEITAATLRAGYKSRDKALTRSVGKTLRSMPNVVKVGRGMFRLK